MMMEGVNSMSTKRVIAVLALAVLASLVFASIALAGSTTDAIIQDASDGTIDGNWTAAQIQAALAAIRNNPVYLQYTDVGGVLEDYLGSSPSPGVQSGGLKFTGSEMFLLLGAGVGLMGSGLALRRRRTQ
jgi:hypothetical protein